MEKFRIYALIIGQVLVKGPIFDCEIKKMSFKEQRKRKFAPIQGTFSNEKEWYKTFVQNLSYFDPIKIKSKYVVVCDIEECSPNAAIGGAVRKIDKIARYLSLVEAEDRNKKIGKNLLHITPYIYQVNKIYSLNDKNEEKEIDYKIESTSTYLPNRPELTQWRVKSTKNFLQNLHDFHDETLERAIKYLYRSSIGYFLLDNHETVALNHFKAIEIIVNSLSNKQNFTERIEEAGNKIKLTQEEKDKIKKLWKDRSMYGDVAHPSKFDQAERYPNQFPLPSNVRYSGSFLDSVAEKVCLKYFDYKKRLYSIDIQDIDDTSEENRLGVVNPWWESNHLFFWTSEKNKEKIKKAVKKKLAEEFNVNEKNVEISFYGDKQHLVALIKQ